MMPNFLPKQFKFSHEFALFLHDILVDIIVSGEEAHIFDVKFELNSKLDANAFSNLSGDELCNWLESNGYNEVIIEMTYKQCIIALLSDFCHFVYEALQCSRKSKLTVAYALLRKPFKQNLFYLEWLLADPEDFIRRFMNAGPKSLDLSIQESMSKVRKIEIIEKAIGKTIHPNWIPSEFMYELRYKKDALYGFEGLCNQAMHLITTFRGYTTEHQNFNFIFSDESAHFSQWTHFYSLLPLILFHAVDIVESLIKTIAKRVNEESGITSLRRSIGFILWTNKSHFNDQNFMLNQIAADLIAYSIECPKCTNQIFLKKKNMSSLYKHGVLTCGRCRLKIDLLNLASDTI